MCGIIFVNNKVADNFQQNTQINNTFTIATTHNAGNVDRERKHSVATRTHKWPTKMYMTVRAPPTVSFEVSHTLRPDAFDTLCFL